MAFKFFDVNADGQIDSDDLKKALLKSGKSIINYEEFQKIIQECNNNKETINFSLKFNKPKIWDFVNYYLYNNMHFVILKS